jgi:hypothetical protein
MNVADARVTASAFHQSGMFPNLKNEAQAFVLILAGAEMGVGAMEAVQGITLIQGKPTMSANLLASLVKRHPRYDYKVVSHTDTACRIEFLQDGEVSGVSEFTLEDAKKAGLGGNQTWKKYTAALLFARALTQGVRWYAPDVTSSAAYTPEELGSEEPPVDPPADTPMDELAQLVAEVGLSNEERDGLREWIKQDRETHTATAIDLLKDGNTRALLAGIEYEVAQ